MNKIIAFVLLATCTAFAQSKPTADLIITNAKVWTVDRSQPTAEAVAVLHDRIMAVGSKTQIDALRGPDTRVVDAGGRLLMPGFNDSHVHFIGGSLQLDQVQLNDATTVEEFVRRVAEQVKKTPKGQWVRGGDWDETKWKPVTLPTKELIDGFTGDTPVFLDRYDGHLALANSVALRMAGITAQTPDPTGGVIVRDAHGDPTGALKDAAKDLVLKVIPPLTHDELLAAARRGLQYAASVGVTSMQEMNDEETDSFADIRTYGELLQKGELTSRFYVAAAISDWKQEAQVGIRHAFGSPFLRIGALKGFADGSLGSGTAYFFDPYTDDPANSGILGSRCNRYRRCRIG